MDNLLFYFLKTSRNIVHNLVAKGLRYEKWCDEKKARRWLVATKIWDKTNGWVYTTKQNQ